MRIGGLILAAGEGRRFGGTKQIAELHGRPLLEYALAAMPPARAHRVVVVLGHAAAEIRATVDLHGAEPVVCERWHEGQAASLRCGLEALGDVDAVVVVLGDQPGITAEAIAGVLDADAGRRRRRARDLRRRAGPSGAARAARCSTARASCAATSGSATCCRGRASGEFEIGHLADPTDIDTREELARR